MFRKLLASAGLGAMVLGGTLVAPLHADEWDKETRLTVNNPISLDGTVLIPGQYVLRLMNSNSTRDVVEIFDRSEDHLVTTVLATPAYRSEPTGTPSFSFYETPAGRVSALETYFYPGDEDGLHFRLHM
jgi:hypothetical protein